MTEPDIFESIFEVCYNGSPKNKTVAIASDFDDTIFDTRMSMHLASKAIKGKRLEKQEVNLLPEEEKSGIYFTAYTKYGHLLKPNSSIINFYARMQKRGADIFILSGRRENLRDETEKKLMKHGIKFKEVLLRRAAKSEHDEDPDVPSWKASKIIELSRHYDIVLLFEDSRQIIDAVMAKTYGDKVKCFLVENPKSVIEVKH
ncbi:MAG: HAD family acid phosphatase [Candidatus Micrarchaeaceae archaeon]